MKTLEEMETGLNLEALKKRHDDDNDVDITSTLKKEASIEEPALVVIYILVLKNRFLYRLSVNELFLNYSG